MAELLLLKFVALACYESRQVTEEKPLYFHTLLFNYQRKVTTLSMPTVSVLLWKPCLKAFLQN